MQILSRLCLVGLFLACSVHANQRSIGFTGIEGEMLENVQANVRLAVLEKEGTVAELSISQWQRLRRAVRDEIKEALHPFGYYRVEITPNHQAQQLSYHIDLGDPVIISKLNVAVIGSAAELDEFKQWQASVKLKLGSVLLQPDYEAAKSTLLALATRLGFFSAQLKQSQIAIAEDRKTAEVDLVLDSGPRYLFGATSISWRGKPFKIRDSVLQTHYGFGEGLPYSADLLAATQNGLQATPYFSSVEVRPDLERAENQAVPVEVILTAGKRHAYNLAVGAGTDTGIRGSVGYENRRLNSSGHHLSTRIGASEVRQTAILNYRIPLNSAPRDSINLLASLEEEDNDFRNFQVSKLGAELARQWRDSTLNFSLTASREKFLVGVDEITTDLVLPSIGWQKIVSDDPYFPSFGWSADFTLRGANESIGSDIDLLQIIGDGRAVVSLGKGRVLARLQAAGTRISDPLTLPASLGFLTGGDRSVRGYRYESIGVPLDSTDGRGSVSSSSEDQISVGRHLVVASMEYEHPLRDRFAVAAFVDAGDAFNRDLNLKKGAGIGLRWRLPFGSLKADLASALDRDGSPLRLHLSFGSDL